MRSRKLFNLVRLGLQLCFKAALALTALFIILWGIAFWQQARSPQYAESPAGLMATTPVQLFNVHKPAGVKMERHVSHDVKTVMEPRGQRMFTLSSYYGSPLGILILFNTALNWAAFLYGLWLLQRIFRNMREDDPFPAGSAQRIRLIALLFIVTDLLKIGYYFAFRGLCQGMFPDVPGVVVSPELNIGGGVVTGMLLLCLAVLFRRGQEIFAEQALTV